MILTGITESSLNLETFAYTRIELDVQTLFWYPEQNVCFLSGNVDQMQICSVQVDGEV